MDKQRPELHQLQASRRQQQLRATTRRFIPVQAQAGRRITKGRGRARVQVHRRLRAVTALQAGRVRRHHLRAVTALQAGRVRHHLRAVTALQAGRVRHRRAATARRAGRQVQVPVQALQAGRPAAAAAAVPVRAAAVHGEDNSCFYIINNCKIPVIAENFHGDKIVNVYKK